MKKILSIITAAVMMFCLFPPVRSFAADTKTVEYIDYVSDGNGGFVPKKKTAECKVIQGSNETLELSTGWYLSDGTVSVQERVEIDGDVHLILSRTHSGSMFTAQNGIHLTDGNTLSIYDMYAEDAEPGNMSVYTSSNRNAAIGGNTDFHGGENCGTLNIYGGIINVEKNEHAAIGGGSSTEMGDAGNGGTVNVYGGKLTAAARNNPLTPAIGGGATREGRSGDGTKLNVYGGEVNAVSYDHTAIGKGNIYSGRGTLGENGTTCISGGSVSAYVYRANSKGAAFDHVPTFGTNYEYNLFCGNSNQNPIQEDPTSGDIYTTKKYVMIEGLYTDVQFNDYSWDGSKIVKNSSIARCKKLSANDLPAVLTSGCYYIDSTIDKPDKTLKIDGDVKLIMESSSTLTVKNIILPKSSSLAYYGGTLKINDGISGQNGNSGTLEANSGKINTWGKIDLSSLIIYTGNIEVHDKLTCPDIRMYGSEYDNNCFSGILVVNAGASLSSAPAFINYIPKVLYRINASDRLATIVDPPSSFYTEKYDMLIINMERAGTNTPACDHSGNTNTILCEGGKCSVCGGTLPAAGHTEAAPVTENRTFTTCTENGSYDEVIYCSVCGKELSRETKVVETSGHSPADPVIENETAALCTESGTYDEVVYCHVCGIEISRETKVSEPLGHTEGKAEVSVPATTSSTGTNVYRCVRCGIILRSETTPVIKMDIPTNVGSSNEPAQVIYTEFPELRFDIEIKNGKAMITWNGIKNADKYVVYAVRNGKMTELEKTKKTEFETKHTSGTGYLVRYMKNGVLSPKSKSVNENIISAKPMVTAVSDKNSVTLRWQDMGAEKYNIYKYVDGKAVKIGSVSGTSVKIKNLDADTEYKFIVTAVIDGKETAMLKSGIVTVKTKQLTVNS